MDREKFKKKPEQGFQSFRPIPIDFQQTKDIDAKPFVFRNLTNEFHIDYPELLTKIKNALQGSVDKGANPVDKGAKLMDKGVNPLNEPVDKPFGEEPIGEEPVDKPVGEPITEPPVTASNRKKGIEKPFESINPNTGDYEKAIMAPPAKGVVQRIPQFDTLILNDKALKERLPKTHVQVHMLTSPYYANNRKLFIEYIGEKLRPYAEKMRLAMETQGCDSRGKDATAFALMEHQAVVSDYLNLMTPYRGLLLYHGLGSGKTCTSIAIAEGMKSEREILLMTPASLNANFFSEIRKCGDPLYKRNQFWEFVPILGKPELVKTLSQALYLTEGYIMKKRGAWMVDAQKEPNYKQLKPEERGQIDDQVDQMIRGKYIDVNYNGLTSNKWKELTNGGNSNPFHNRVVIIDEVHKFVSLIVNKLKAVKPAPTEAYKIYNWLLEAQNCRLVFLTGTPMINYPNEIAVLFNMLRGYIKEWEISLSPGHNLSAETIEKRLESNGFLSFDLVRLGNDNKLRITRNPFGFIREVPSDIRAKPSVKPVQPIGEPVAKPIGSTAVKPIGSTAVKPIGSTAVKPIGSTAVKPVVEQPTEQQMTETKPLTQVTKKNYGGRAPTNTTRRKTLQEIPSNMKSKPPVTTVQEPNTDQEPNEEPNDEQVQHQEFEFVDDSEKPLQEVKDIQVPTSNDESKDIQEGLSRFSNDVKSMSKRLEQGDMNSDESTGFVESRSQGYVRSKGQGQGEGEVASALDLDYVEETDENPTYTFDKDANANPYPGMNLSEKGMIGGSATGRIILDETGNMNDTVWLESLKRILSKIGIPVGNIKLNRYKALPDTVKDFADKFIEIEAESFKMRGMKNKVIFQKRVLGITSFFRSDREDLMPPFVLSKSGKPYEEIRVDMSEYQYGKYSQIRTSEITQESKQKKKPKNVAEGQEDYFEKKSSYRQFSRAACNFAFPDEIGGRPYPESKQGKKGGDGGDDNNDNDNDNDIDAIDEEPVLEPDNDSAGGSLNTNTNPISKPPVRSFGTTSKKVGNPVLQGNLEDQQDALQVENPPLEPEVIDEDLMEDVETDDVLNKGSAQYRKAVTTALVKLKTGSNQYLSKQGLKTYSPKFLRMIEQIDANQGCQLVYSQFRSVEGIEIFRYALEANGYEQLTVFRNSATGVWDCSPLTRGKKRYLLFTGTESEEEKRYLLNIYNGAWSIGEITQPMLEKVSAINGNNIMGEVVQVFMITSSGAEGLSLMNTRVVHIMEPYWHWVRLEQVIGRARRICSHQDLPENLRNVQVFIYQSQMSQEQRRRNRESQGSKQLELMDASKRQLDETGQPLTLTTDQMLLEISLTKDEQNQTFLNAVKETAIDCVLYDTDSANPRHCFRFAKSSATDIAFKPSLEEDLTEVPDKVPINKNLKKINHTDKITKVITTYRIEKNVDDVGRYILYNNDSYEQGELVKADKVLVVVKDPVSGEKKMRIEDDK